jgi:hypothetical protein
MDVVSITFPQCDHQYYNGFNGFYDPCIYVKWITYSYPFPLSTSSSPPWKIPGALSAWNLLVAFSCGLCFPDTMLVHTPHPLSLA